MNNNESIFLQNFGNKVKNLRENAGLSQEKLADNSGLHRTYIGMIERAEKTATIVSALKIASALKVSITELFNENS